MPYSVDIIEELQILTLYNLANAQEGLKIHHSAEPSSIAATTLALRSINFVKHPKMTPERQT